MRFLPLALLLALAAPQAQAQLVPSLDLGVAGGVNFANIGDATNFDLDSSTGYHIGAYADFGFLFASARTGLYYFRVGAVDDAGDDGETLSFITVPIDFQVQTPTPIVKAYALVGPEFRFPLGDAISAVTSDEEVDVNTAVNVGIGVKGGVPLIGPSGFLELRYGYDLTGVSDNEDGDEDVKVHLVMIRAGVGI